MLYFSDVSHIQEKFLSKSKFDRLSASIRQSEKAEGIFMNSDTAANASLFIIFQFTLMSDNSDRYLIFGSAIYVYLCLSEASYCYTVHKSSFLTKEMCMKSGRFRGNCNKILKHNKKAKFV